MKTKHLGVIVSSQILKPKSHDNCWLVNVDIFQIIMTKIIPVIICNALHDVGPLPSVCILWSHLLSPFQPYQPSFNPLVEHIILVLVNLFLLPQIANIFICPILSNVIWTGYYENCSTACNKKGRILSLDLWSDSELRLERKKTFLAREWQEISGTDWNASSKWKKLLNWRIKADVSAYTQLEW